MAQCHAQRITRKQDGVHPYHERHDEAVQSLGAIWPGGVSIRFFNARASAEIISPANGRCSGVVAFIGVGDAIAHGGAGRIYAEIHRAESQR